MPSSGSQEHGKAQAARIVEDGTTSGSGSDNAGEQKRDQFALSPTGSRHYPCVSDRPTSFASRWHLRFSAHRRMSYPRWALEGCNRTLVESGPSKMRDALAWVGDQIQLSDWRGFQSIHLFIALRGNIAQGMASRDRQGKRQFMCASLDSQFLRPFRFGNKDKRRRAGYRQGMGPDVCGVSHLREAIWENKDPTSISEHRWLPMR